MTDTIISDGKSTYLPKLESISKCLLVHRISLRKFGDPTRKYLTL
jgi:hypothetical protein